MRRTTILALSLALPLSLSAGCSRGSNPESTTAPVASATATPGPMGTASPSPATSSPSPAAAGTLALGERITSPMVSLSDIAKDPAKYRGQVIATSGKVTAVCQEMGCWMQLEDASGQAHVRMHGHHFFVPKTAPGHLARVQATLVPADNGGAAACAEGNACEEGKPAAKLELDATGVEID
jgi:hypothetical protein